ncbi:Urease accessory protein UreH [compost metagenome]
MPRGGGEIAATFALVEGRTELIHKYHTAPLKIAKTFRYANERLSITDEKQNEHDQLGIYMMDCSPGLMSGDEYELSWHLQAGTSVFLTNQSFTKVHPSLENNKSSQKQIIRIGAHAVLEYMPEPVMLYKDANFDSDTDVNMEKGATLILSDILCPGRSQRGEQFQYKHYTNRLKVYVDEELIYYQNQRIEPQVMNLQAPGCWEDQTHLGNLYVFSEHIRQKHVDLLLAAIVERLENDSELNEKTWPVRFGASLTYKYGLTVTIMGQHAWQLQQLLTEAWQAIRASLLGLMPLFIHK